MSESLLVFCPQCKKKFAYYSSVFRPFCCERCKMVDLGHWLSESYSVAGEKLKPEEFAALYDDQEESSTEHILTDEFDRETDDY
ncbi:MAG: DNA gyrase inhibitor YacG [Bacteriovoracaceae bacterium]